MSTSYRRVFSAVPGMFRSVTRAACVVRDADGPIIPAVSATAFPLVVYSTGVPGPCLLPLLAIAVGAWVDAVLDAVRRRR